MKCSYQFGSNLDQSKRVFKTCKLDEIGTREGEVRFSSCVPLPITSRTKGTRDDQQFYYSLEGGDLGGCRTQGFGVSQN